LVGQHAWVERRDHDTAEVGAGREWIESPAVRQLHRAKADPIWPTRFGDDGRCSCGDGEQ
jgi:hypothetical protein